MTKRAPNRILPTQETLRELFDYDSLTGVVRWRISAGSVKAGAEAGSLKPKGYRRVRIGGVFYLLHRIIWRLVIGEEPVTVDHIDRNPRNNRLVNLRDASMVEQNNNRRDNLSLRGGAAAIVAARLREVGVTTVKYRDVFQRNNTSGAVGVCWHKNSQRWEARITIDGRDMHLGCFVTRDDAALARQAAVAVVMAVRARALA